LDWESNKETNAVLGSGENKSGLLKSLGNNLISEQAFRDGEELKFEQEFIDQKQPEFEVSFQLEKMDVPEIPKYLNSPIKDANSIRPSCFPTLELIHTARLKSIDIKSALLPTPSPKYLPFLTIDLVQPSIHR